MNFQPTKFDGVWLVELKPVQTGIGHLARTYCQQEFSSRGLNTTWPQCNETLTLQRGTLRGMHWQVAPHGETKLVRCVHGHIWDVVVDVRPGSKTFGQHQSFELKDSDLTELYIPEGFAHGLQALSDNCVLHYQMSTEYSAESARGFRWDDPRVAIQWPLPVSFISDRDAAHPPLTEVVCQEVHA